jgi:purine-nucleoside phosphorylase
MSTVLEVIAARHLAMQVLGISCITNLAAGLTGEQLSEGDVLETAARVRDQFAALLRAILRRCPPAREGGNG